MLKKKSSSNERKRKHSHVEERRDARKRQSTESSVEVRLGTAQLAWGYYMFVCDQVPITSAKLSHFHKGHLTRAAIILDV